MSSVWTGTSVLEMHSLEGARESWGNRSCTGLWHETEVGSSEHLAPSEPTACSLREGPLQGSPWPALIIVDEAGGMVEAEALKICSLGHFH